MRIIEEQRLVDALVEFIRMDADCDEIADISERVFGGNFKPRVDWADDSEIVYELTETDDWGGVFGFEEE